MMNNNTADGEPVASHDHTIYLRFPLPVPQLNSTDVYRQNTEVTFKFFRAKTHELFTTAATFTENQIPTVDITDMKLYVKLITPNPELGMILDQQYLKSNVYQYERFNCNTVTVAIPSGNFTYPIYDGASRPAKLFIGFQNPKVNDALANTTEHPDPSLFEPCKITKIYLEVNGSKNIPYLNQRELGFQAENFGQAYTDLMRCTKFYDNKSVSSIVSRSMFRKGYTIFAFDLHENIKDLPELNVTKTAIKLKVSRANVINADIAAHDAVPMIPADLTLNMVFLIVWECAAVATGATRVYEEVFGKN
ncbi:hypothetical protein PAPYR_10793 [Paratrimastix pyriformis]|uniref:Uncharacterized protein n=1 Tax=Paratrimastix pyriformis TaxID=342808 RepID=A0ABQ8U9E7_9EUKA|nr:hypothetical protein PAPYR_10793 [Paratrimastix pyriformis]